MLATRSRTPIDLPERPSLFNKVWPADRFFWSVLPDPAGHALRRPGPLPASLLPTLADDLPIALTDLHAVAAPISHGRLLVCAARRDDLATLDPTTISLTPGSVPERLGTNADPAELNLLVGRYEPPRIRNRRHRRHNVLCLLTVLCSAAITAGLHRRAAHFERTAEIAHGLALARATDAVGPLGDAGDPFAALARERAAVHQLSQFTQTLTPPADAALDFSAALAAWPIDLKARPQSFRVSADSIAISALIPDDPAPLLARFRPPAGWRLAEPRVAAVANGDPTQTVRVTLELTRAGDVTADNLRRLTATHTPAP